MFGSFSIRTVALRISGLRLAGVHVQPVGDGLELGVQCAHNRHIKCIDLLILRIQKRRKVLSLSLLGAALLLFARANQRLILFIVAGLRSRFE